MQKELNDIANDFELLGNWDQRYQYLVELGEKLEPMPEDKKIEANRVIPCMSNVWVYAYPNPNNSDTLLFHGDCDTAIIKGVVALLVQLFSGKKARHILEYDVDLLFERIQLSENLSPNRHVGIYAIIEVMKDQVRHTLEAPPVSSG